MILQIYRFYVELQQDGVLKGRFPEWILFGIALAVILVLLFDPFNAL